MDRPWPTSDHRSHTALPKISIPSRRNLDGPLFRSDSSKAEAAKTERRAIPRSDPKDGNTSDNTKTELKKHHSRHLHRRHHRHHTARETIQSAVQLQNPFSFEGYNPLRRTHDKYDKHANPNSRFPQGEGEVKDDETRQNSTSPSQTPQSQQQQSNSPPTLLHQESQSATTPLKKHIHPSSIPRERKRRAIRAEEVQAALNALSRDAHTATRKLDDTYYSLLEHLGSLKSSLSSLQDLSMQATRTREEWERDVAATGKEMEEKIMGFGAFEQQERDVDGLVGRLETGKKRHRECEERLEGCRGRLERIQKKEEEDRRVGSWRWKIFWGVLGAVIVLGVLVALWRGGGHSGEEQQRENEPSSSLLVEVKERSAQIAAEVGIKDTQRRNRTAPAGLRLVDEGYEKQKQKEEKKWNRLLDEL